MFQRKLVSWVFVAFCAASVLIALVPLVLLLSFVVTRGISALNLEFFTSMPKPVGEPGGGMANAIVGTLILAGLGSLLAIPIGILSGVYMSEYAGSRFASAIRFAADTLNGVPSIVIGVFAYAIAVLPFKRFSALAPTPQRRPTGKGARNSVTRPGVRTTKPSGFSAIRKTRPAVT